MYGRLGQGNYLYCRNVYRWFFRWSNSREVLNEKNAKQIVHELYNDISISKDPKYSDILEVLQKVYLKLEKQKYELDPSPLINRLVNYLYFTAYTNKIRFTEYQEELIRNLSEIGRTAGINGLYRADYGDKSQF